MARNRKRADRTARGVVTLIGVLCLVGASATMTAKAESAAEAIAAGDAAVEAFDLDAALAAYRRALDADPESYEAAWKLARARLDEATLLPDDEDEGEILQEAERLARRAIEANPDGTMGRTFLAIALGRRAQAARGRRRVELSREVKSQAEAAIELDPDVDLPYHVLGVWHREMAGLSAVLRRLAEWIYGGLPSASFDEAAANLRRAAELAPEVVAHRVELGITLAAMNRRSEAREVLEGAIEMPQTWVTDDHFRKLASDELRRLR